MNSCLLTKCVNFGRWNYDVIRFRDAHGYRETCLCVSLVIIGSCVW